MTSEKTCPVCGKTFAARQHNHITCSPECRRQRRRQRSREYSEEKRRQRALRKNCLTHRRIYDEHEKRFAAIVAAADAAGLSYGEYVIRQRIAEQKGAANA